MRAIHWALSLAFAMTFAAACSGPTVPLSAQAGSSVVIPLTGELTQPTSLIGYGSELLGEDYQRGELVYRLRETETELRTRATSAIRLGRSSGDAGNVQIVSLVDIPADSPVGTFSIDVVRRFRDSAGAMQESPLPYSGTLSVLPHALDVDCDQTVDVVGVPTPWARLGPAGGSDSIAEFASFLLAQRPELVLSLNRAVHAVELELSYPPDVIRIEEVTAAWGREAKGKLAWWNETAPGQVSIGMLGGAAFTTVAVAFSLLDGESQILDPASVGVTIRSATDASGTELPTAVAATAIR